MTDNDMLAKLQDSDAIYEATFNWDQDYQREIQSILLHDRPFLIESVGLVEPQYFDNDVHQLIARVLFKFWEDYKVIPNKNQIKQELLDKLKGRPLEVQAQYLSEFETVLNFYIPNLEGREHYRNRIVSFAKKMAMKKGIQKVLDILKKTGVDEEEMWQEIGEILKHSSSVDRDFDMGLDYFQTVQERYLRKEEKKEKKEIFTSGFQAIDQALKNDGLVRGEIGAIMGTCFRKGTRVLMFDGTTKAVEDVVVGDLVMGNDSTQRMVLTLGRGRDMMYEVRPVKGDPYYVNSRHILSLKSCAKTFAKRSVKIGGKRRKTLKFNSHSSKSGEVFNISVIDYLKESNNFRNLMKGYRVGVSFPSKIVKIDPYILGCWLGDGDKHRASITNIDEPVIEAWKKECNNRGLSVSVKEHIHLNAVHTKQEVYVRNQECNQNSLQNDLKSYGLIWNFKYDSGGLKHIPVDYKRNSREVRLQILAGLMDTDGSMASGGFDFVNKNKQLAEDVVFVARSLGLAAYIKPCKKQCCNNGVWGDYWRVSISGDCSQIPTRIERKKAQPRKQIKDHLVTGITVTPVGEEDYYGFSVDKNHLFLLDDFTVTHNSGSGKSLFLVTSAIANLHRGKKVLYVSLEIDQDAVADRFDAQLANYGGDRGVNTKNLLEKKEIVFEQLDNYVKDYEQKTLLIVKQFPSGTLDMMAFRAYFQQISMHGFRPDLVIIDYVGEMRDYANMPTHESRYRIVRDFRGFAVEERVCGLTALQPNKSGKETINAGLLMDDEHLGDSYSQVKPLDALWSINQRMDEKECCLGRIKVCKHRDGESKIVFPIRFNYNTLAISQITQGTYDTIHKTHMNQRKTEIGEKLASDSSKVHKIIAEGQKEIKKTKFNVNSEYSQEEVAPE